MFRLGFIDYNLGEWHENNYPKFLKECVGDEVVVAYAYGQITSPKPRKMLEEFERCRGTVQR